MPQENSGDNGLFRAFQMATIPGTVGQDPTFFAFGNEGRRLSRFSIAHTAWVKGESKTTWINVINFDAADWIEENIHKGSRVKVVGNLYQDSYEKNGEVTETLSFNAAQVLLVASVARRDNSGSNNAPAQRSSNKPAARPAPARRPAAGRTSAPAPNVEEADADETDLPF